MFQWFSDNSFKSISTTFSSSMGNVLRFLCFDKPSTKDDEIAESYTPQNVSSLVHHLFNFENTSLVPEELSSHVVSSRRDQINCYRKLLEAWKQARPQPRTAEEAARLVVETLAGHKKEDVKGLLAFYGLPIIYIDVETSTLPEGVKFEMDTLPVDPRSVPDVETSTVPEGVIFEMDTLPVNRKLVPDGDGVTVYVSTEDRRESSHVPESVQMAALQRAQARARREKKRAKELHAEIVDAGYRVIYLKNNKKEVLARQYRIRLRGIDAPENSMPYGKEAKEALVKIVQGKCLKVQVYDKDQYGRYVADVYCEGRFVQELMLNKGLAWHYTAYDKREELARWEKQARAERRGLWAAPNPEKPWKWRKKQRLQTQKSNGC